MEEEVSKFYKGLFATEGVPDLNGCGDVHMLMLTDEDKLVLSEPVSKDEIKKAVMSMNSFKTPGCDGFHVFFYKQYWDIIGDDVWRLVHSAFA